MPAGLRRRLPRPRRRWGHRRGKYGRCRPFRPAPQPRPKVGRAWRDLGRGQEGGELVHAAAGDPAQHRVVGGRPGVAMAARFARFGGLLAGNAQRAAVVAVEHVPDPGDRGLPLRHLGGEITAHAIGRRAFARHHRQAACLRLVVERLHQLMELAGRQAVDGFEGNGSAARLDRPLRPDGCRGCMRPAPSRNRRPTAHAETHVARRARRARTHSTALTPLSVAAFFKSLSLRGA